MKIVRVTIVKNDSSEQDPKDFLEPSRLGWFLGILLYPIKVVLHDYCYLGFLRLTSPAYRKHLYWLDLQTKHLHGLHSEGPDPDCEYCTVR